MFLRQAARGGAMQMLLLNYSHCLNGKRCWVHDSVCLCVCGYLSLSSFLSLSLSLSHTHTLTHTHTHTHTVSSLFLSLLSYLVRGEGEGAVLDVSIRGV